MSSDLTQILIFVATIAIALFTLWQAKTAITAASITEAAKTAAPLADELAKVAEMGVMAAEEYRRTGEFKTGDEALRFAIGFVKRWIPASRGFTDDDILTAIHAFVPAAKALTAQIAAAKATVADARAAPNDAGSPLGPKPLHLGR